MSFSQQQVWLHGQIVGEIPLYNQAITIYRRGPLDVRVLERCLLEIVRRHEIWRTTFDRVGDEPVQIVHPAPEKFSLPIIDLRGLSKAERETEAVRLATEDARRPMDFRSGPLFRVLLVKMEDDEHRLYMTLHHLIFDAVTVYGVFVPELETLYEAFSAGKSSPLPEPRRQYADFACWQREQVSSEAWSQHLSYWRRQLEGDLPVCQWPSDRARPAIDSHRGAIERFSLPAPLVKSLRAASQEAGVTLYMSLLAGFVAVLHRYTGQQDFIIGTLTAGRFVRKSARVAHRCWGQPDIPRAAGSRAGSSAGRAHAWLRSIPRRCQTGATEPRSEPPSAISNCRFATAWHAASRARMGVADGRNFERLRRDGLLHGDG
jgi:hypothetical protein